MNSVEIITCITTGLSIVFFTNIRPIIYPRLDLLKDSLLDTLFICLTTITCFQSAYILNLSDYIVDYKDVVICFAANFVLCVIVEYFIPIRNMPIK